MSKGFFKIYPKNIFVLVYSFLVNLFSELATPVHPQWGLTVIVRETQQSYAPRVTRMLKSLEGWNIEWAKSSKHISSSLTADGRMVVRAKFEFKCHRMRTKRIIFTKQTCAFLIIIIIIKKSRMVYISNWKRTLILFWWLKGKNIRWLKINIGANLTIIYFTHTIYTVYTTIQTTIQRTIPSKSLHFGTAVDLEWVYYLIHPVNQFYTLSITPT